MSAPMDDPTGWDWMTVEVPATMPGGYAACLTPTLRELAPLHAAGWQTHEHMWMGNGYVRITLKRGKGERPAGLLEAMGRGVERENRHGRSPYGVDLRTPGERAADEAHLAKLHAIGDENPVAWRAEFFQGLPSERPRPVSALAAEIWPEYYGTEMEPMGSKMPAPEGTPIDDSAARRAWGMRQP